MIRILNLSLFKKCDPRISLELIGIFQGGGIGRPDGFFAKAKTRLGMSTVKALDHNSKLDSASAFQLEYRQDGQRTPS